MYMATSAKFLFALSALPLNAGLGCCDSHIWACEKYYAETYRGVTLAEKQAKPIQVL
jgi:hypothetical protein